MAQPKCIPAYVYVKAITFIHISCLIVLLECFFDLLWPSIHVDAIHRCRRLALLVLTLAVTWVPTGATRLVIRELDALCGATRGTCTVGARVVVVARRRFDVRVLRWKRCRLQQGIMFKIEKRQRAYFVSKHLWIVSSLMKRIFKNVFVLQGDETRFANVKERSRYDV